MTETRIASFVVRFMEEGAGAMPPEPPWRGVIRHVQTRREMRFTRIEEALQFMSQYVDLEVTRPPRAGFVANDGVRLHFLDYGGDGPPLILLPGLTANAHMFDGLAAAGLTRSFHVAALDMRGRGQSDKPATGYSMGAHAADVIALMDACGWQTATVLGHSFGGLIATYLAANAPERVDRLIILDASHLLITERTRQMVQPILDRLGQRLPSLDAYLQGVRRAPYLRGAWDDALASYYRSDVAVYDDGSVQALARPEAIAETIAMEFEEPWADYLGAVTQPVLLLNALEPFGDDSAAPILPAELAEATAACLSNCAYQVVPGNHVTMIFGDNAVHVVAAIHAWQEATADAA
jgi:pimeloyl-ACP methyl ester carboxylesterase